MLNRIIPSSCKDLRKLVQNRMDPPVLLCTNAERDWHELGGMHNVSDINELTDSFSIDETLRLTSRTPVDCILSNVLVTLDSCALIR